MSDIEIERINRLAEDAGFDIGREEIYIASGEISATCTEEVGNLVRLVRAESAAELKRLQAENAELQQAKQNICSLLDRALAQNEAMKKELKFMLDRFDKPDNIFSQRLACQRARKAIEDPDCQQKGQS